MVDRAHDIVLFGATGFTGQLTAQYLARNAPAQLRWAIAGRNAAKLNEVRRRVLEIDSRRDVQVVIADTSDPASLDAMACNARVVATTVGPYADYGEPVVRACVEHGTDYLDITGEPDFVSGIRKSYDERARETGSLLVSCCGFDSIPADLGTLFTVGQLPTGTVKTVEAFVNVKGGASGGTWNSLVKAMAKGAPARESSGGRGRRLDRSVRYREEVRGWALPMPVIDPVIVKRTSRARPDDYGTDFAYAQFLRLGSRVAVAQMVGGAAGVFLLSQLKPTRDWLLSLRKPGQGPSEAERIRSFFQVTFVGTTDRGDRVVTRVSGGDAGYDETSKMLAECALMTATRRDELGATAGAVTTGEVFGQALIDRLNDVGITFETLSA